MATVHKAVDLFLQADTDEKYDDLPNQYAQRFGDRTLAQESHYFLPEICAEIAFGEQVRLSEQVGLLRQGGEPVHLYKNQLCDCYALRDAIDRLFQSGVYGKRTNDIFRQFVGMGALLFPVREDFEVR